MDFTRRSYVSVHAPTESAANSPIEPSAPAGPARSVLPVHDEPDRGRKPVIGDELVAVATKWQYTPEQVRSYR